MPPRTTLDEIATRVSKQSDRRAAVYVPYLINEFWDKIFHSPKSAIVATFPRDTGKTAGAVQFLDPDNDFCWALPGTVGAWGSIEYKHITKTFLPEVYTRVPGCRFVKESNTLYLPNGCEIWTYACSDVGGVDRIRGVKRPDFWIWDECSFYHPDFFSICEPNYRPGTRRLYITSKLAGSFTQDLVERIAPSDPNYFDIFDYPFEAGLPVKPAHLTREQWLDKIERARLTLPRAMFEREILNLWGDREGAVFIGVDMAWKNGTSLGFKPSPDMPLGIGIDLAQTLDYTAVVACDMHGNIYPLLHIQGMGWQEQVQRAVGVIKQYSNAMPAWVDATGVGAPVYEMLVSAGIPCYGVQMGAKPAKDAPLIWRDQLVLQFSLCMERGQRAITHSQQGEQLVSELHQYIYTPSHVPGKYHYGAASGHDDLVTATMLASAAAERLPKVLQPKTNSNSIKMPDKSQLPSMPKVSRRQHRIALS